MALVGCASLAMSAVVIGARGIQLGTDAGRYIPAAQELLAGHIPTAQRASSYLGFETILAAVIALTGRPQAVVWVNALAVAIAAAVVAALAGQLSGSLADAAAAAVFVANIEFAVWSGYVLTDALYAAAVVFAVAAIYFAGERRGGTYAVAAAAALFAALVRPNGWLLVPVALVYLIGRRRPSLAAIAVLAFAALTLIIAPRVSEVDSVKPEQALVEGRVIWGSDAWRVSMPAPLRPVADWSEGLQYGLEHPLASLRLAAVRIGAELLHARPFYSRNHNLVVVAFYMPLYALALLGLWRARAQPLARLIAITVGAHLALVGVTFADWDGRFLIHVAPLITVLAGSGLSSAVSRDAAPLPTLMRP
jgi:hypothetical protein